VTLEVAGALWLLLAAFGLALSVSYAGLPVLGQGAFVAIGGFGTALLGPGGAGLPLGVAVVLSVVIAGVLGHLVALGASRLEGASLALATWALAWLVQRALTAYPQVSGGAGGLTRSAPAHLVTTTLGLDLVLTPAVHVVLAGLLCLLAAAALIRLDHGPAGLDLAGLREGPELAVSLGVPVAARRRAVLTVTAAMGALSGAGTFVLLGLVSATDVGPLLSLQLFVAVLVGGTARWWGPVLGVALLTALPPVADVLAVGVGADPERARGVLTAALLVLVLALRRLLVRPSRAANRASLVAPPPVASGPARPVLLRAESLSASYDGVVALDGAALALRGGEVHALVGPNGSGKSTLLRCLAGELDVGLVQVAGVRHVARTVQDRVLAGVVRTPQPTVVLPRINPERQVGVGARGGSRSSQVVLRHLLATPSSRLAERRRAVVVAAALSATGLAHVRGVDPSRLTVGEQRLLQVARAVATGARVLLLDEPAAGMTGDERRQLRAVLRTLAGNGAAVLLVEHDMRLVGQVADQVTVLDAGRVLATGRPDQVRADPAVRRAYLGSVVPGTTQEAG
jgi:branched-chain amino acid transport system permease protein